MSGYNVRYVGCWKKETLNRIFGTLSIIVAGHLGCLTYEHFLSDSSVIREMLGKWDDEKFGSGKTDMDPILISANEETISF